MAIEITLNKGRCFFNGFNDTNDKNPITGKAGVDYCRYQFIGAIFSLLGLTLGIPCKKNGSFYKCYVYKGGFKDWVKSHEKDLDAPFDMAKRMNSSIAELYVKTICEHKQKQKIQDSPGVITQGSPGVTTTDLTNRTINPGKPLSYEQVLEKAENDFSKHQYKSEILINIKQQLDKYSYKEKISTKSNPDFIIGAFEWQENCFLMSLNENERKLYQISRRFVNSLPGIDVTPFPNNGIFLC